MPVSFRMLAATAVAAAAMTVPFCGAVATAAAHAGAAPRPGLTAAPITLASDTTLAGGYDAATTAAGTTYIAWLGDTGTGRIVHLCVLRPARPPVPAASRARHRWAPRARRECT